MTRFKEGDEFLLGTVSNIAGVVSAAIVVRYDNGERDEFLLADQTLSGISLIPQGFTFNKVARLDGVVTSAIAANRAILQSVPRGRIWGGLSLSRSGIPYAPLCSGYIYDLHFLSLGQFEEAGQGRVPPRTITGTDPAAGAEVSIAVPANTAWEILSVSVPLVTNTVVANRNAYLVADDGTTANRQWILTDTTAQTASLTVMHLWQRGSGLFNTAGSTLTDTQVVQVKDGLPETPLFEYARLRTVSPNLAAGDNYGAPILRVKEWVFPS